MNNYVEVDNLEERIKRNSALYFFRSTPFTEYGEYNYNGALKRDFFFKNLFSNKGNCEEYINTIVKSIFDEQKKSVILIGNQGCGKTTFLHYLEDKIMSKAEFNILDFDKDTSNPKLEDFIEKFSAFLHNKMIIDYSCNNMVNKRFYNLYYCNKELILKKVNGANNVRKFFEEFNQVFILKRFDCNTPENFINNIDKLFFNQILSLVILWYIASFLNTGIITPIVFGLDNLDVLVNSEIITGFFDEYFLFVRNIDSLIQNLDNNIINKVTLEYNKIFTFIFCCRQHTWVKVKRSYVHQGNIINLSTKTLYITDAFDKNAILERRENYINNNKQIYNEFSDKVTDVKSLLEDMKESHNIYDLFNDDYRQCSITFEMLLDNEKKLLEKYVTLKDKMACQSLYGARGMIYKSLFNMFKDNNIFTLIGVADVSLNEPPVSDARMILNYLDYHTFGRTNISMPFEKIVSDFSGIISKDRINYSLIQMFNLGLDSIWNELISFVQIDTDDLENCDGTKVFITKAGHEYLDLISTHFEFFNARVYIKRSIDTSLFDPLSEEKYIGSETYVYNFQETIQNVINIVKNCCMRMSKFYSDKMFPRQGGKTKYLKSEFVYHIGRANVFHGERIIHTHIRYIDHYRLFLLKGKPKTDKNSDINMILVNFIKDYIDIGKSFPNITSSISADLFPKFEKKIEVIETSGYTDYETPINV